MERNQQFALQCDSSACIGCMACVSACAFGAIHFTDDELLIDTERCRLCRACVESCPSEALSICENVWSEEKAWGENVFVLVEMDGNRPAQVSLELLGAASSLATQLGQQVEALLLGGEVKGCCDELIAYGADRVHIWEHPLLAAQIEEHYAEVLVSYLSECHPNILLVGATSWGRGLSARMAAMLHTGLTADCTEFSIQDETGLLLQKRPAFGGNLLATIVTPLHRPQMASVRPGIMKANVCNMHRKGTIVVHDCASFAFDTRVCLLAYAENIRRSCQLENSKIVIGIGRGVKNQKVLDDVKVLAAGLGATVGASRAAVEAGLLDASVQIGQTGHTIAPDLYLALGISGQIQHIAAIGGAKKVIAVNRDPAAPIFRVADYGWVGSVEEALPVLLQTLKSRS